MAYLLPLAAMLLSDLVLGYTRYDWHAHARHPAGRLCLLSGHHALGPDDSRSAFGVAGGRGGTGWVALVFRGDEFRHVGLRTIYPLTASGLAACYAAAIPFFRNSLVGDAFFTAILFGGLAMVENRVAWMRESAASVSA